MNEPLRSRLFRLFAVAFAAAGLFHATAFFHPEIAEAVPRYWHALFVFVNAGLVVGVLKRPPWFPFVYALYTLQQWIEHGVRGMDVWQSEHRLDWASVVSVVFVPIVLVLLIADARQARAERT